MHSSTAEIQRNRDPLRRFASASCAEHGIERERTAIIAIAARHAGKIFFGWLVIVLPPYPVRNLSQFLYID